MDRLETELLALRAQLDKGFSPDTALNGLQSDIPSTGHCATVAAIAWKMLGGSLVSANINGISHWFNRVQIGDQLIDFDLTGDQFDYPAVQFNSVEELYPHTRERSPVELDDETLHRAALLARRVGLLKAAETLEKRGKSTCTGFAYDLKPVQETQVRVGGSNAITAPAPLHSGRIPRA